MSVFTYITSDQPCSVVGVVGGVWCCAGWAFRISSKAIDVVSGADRSPGLVAAEATGTSIKKKWGGGELRARVTRQGAGWTVEGDSSPYASYVGTPVTGTGPGFPPPYSPYAQAPLTPHTPYSNVHTPAHGTAPPSALPSGVDAASLNGGAYAGLGLPSPSVFATQQGGTLPPSPYGVYPPTPNPSTPSFGPQSPPGPPRRIPSKDKDTKKD